MTKTLVGTAIVFTAGAVAGVCIEKFAMSAAGRKILDKAKQACSKITNEAKNAADTASEKVESVNDVVDDYMKERLGRPPIL